MIPKPCFRLTHVKVFRGDRTLLHIPHLELSAGRTTAIVGPSGAGKSTLLRVLAGLESPSQGELHAHGPSGYPFKWGDVVLVFQRPALLSGTVAENVAVGLRLRGQRNVSTQVAPWLERLGLADKARQSVRTLSGGEYQRVALARALILRPSVLLLDEPTSNLDPENVALIEQLVREQQAELGMTVVWVTHQPVQARRVADSVLLLMRGTVIEHAPPETFFSDAANPQTRDFLHGRLIW